jgi:hypothetical protein
METGSLTSECHRVMLVLEASEERDGVPCLFQSPLAGATELLPLPLPLWHSLLCSFPFLIWPLAIGLQAQLGHPGVAYLEVLNMIVFAKTLFQTGPHSQIPGLRT